MLNKIKALADEAIALQNKLHMDEVLREISAMCEINKEDEDAIHQMNQALQKGELSKKPKKGELSKKPKAEKGEKNGK